MTDQNRYARGPQRIDWIDMAKGITMLLVLFGHLPGSGNNPWFPDIVGGIAIIYYFHMPAFFFLSGLTFKANDSFPAFLFKRVRRLLVPYFFFSLYAIGKILISWSAPAMFEGFHAASMGSPAHELLIVATGQAEGLWFFWALFWGDIVLWLVARIPGMTRKYVLWAMVIVCLGIWYALIPNGGHPDTPFQLQDVFEAVAFTGMGWLLMPHLRQLRAPWIPTTAAVAIFALLCALRGWTQPSEPARALLVVASSVAGVMLVAFASMLLPSLRWLTFIGRNTIVFYGLNGLSLALGKKLFFTAAPIGTISNSLLLQIAGGLCVIAIACLACLAATLVINKWFWWAIGARRPSKTTNSPVTTGGR